MLKADYIIANKQNPQVAADIGRTIMRLDPNCLRASVYTGKIGTEHLK